MKLATSLKEISQVFRFNDKYLEEKDSNVYENLYAKQMRELELAIEDSEIHYDTFYITGQTGNGKSTAVNHLKSHSAYIQENYDVRHLFANDIFDFSDELTIVDVLIMVGVSLVEGNEALKAKYLEKLQKLKDLHVGKLEESSIEEKSLDTKQSASLYAQGEVGFLKLFKFGGSLKQDYSSSEKNRTLLRKLFLPNRKELLDLVNSIIKEHNLNEGKKLLLILDDLEKKNVSDELFTIHIRTFRKTRAY